ncbi:hypothetical protein DIPPA_15436 [Diplonema papillatum]|nr:hypothetical protein DIPPA_15436 [Diplonema papillatum]
MSRRLHREPPKKLPRRWIGFPSATRCFKLGKQRRDGLQVAEVVHGKTSQTETTFRRTYSGARSRRWPKEVRPTFTALTLVSVNRTLSKAGSALPCSSGRDHYGRGPAPPPPAAGGYGLPPLAGMQRIWEEISLTIMFKKDRWEASAALPSPPPPPHILRRPVALAQGGEAHVHSADAGFREPHAFQGGLRPPVQLGP